MDFVPLLVAAAMVAVLVDVVRSARGGDWNSVVTPLVAWIVGVGVALLLANSDFAASVSLGDTGYTLDNVNNFSLILFGFAFGSVAAKGVDLLKAIDGNDSQKKEPLLPPAGE